MPQMTPTVNGVGYTQRSVCDSRGLSPSQYESGKRDDKEQLAVLETYLTSPCARVCRSTPSYPDDMSIAETVAIKLHSSFRTVDMSTENRGYQDSQ
jgi:hypothetical protein